MLRHVKELKEERLLRELQAKKRQVLEAGEIVLEKRHLVEESLATFDLREKKIYDKILEKVVGVDAIEQTKEDVKSLQREHQRLEDALQRALHIKKRLETELQEVRKAHAHSMAVREKYVEMTRKLKEEADAETERKEEVEIEDIFSTRGGITNVTH